MKKKTKRSKKNKRTEKSDMVIKQLYVLRAATAKLLTYFSNPELVQDSFPNIVPNTKAPGKLTNVYPVLERLVDIKLVIKNSVNELDSRVYYLSPSGMDLACELLDIPDGYIGEGFNEDYGHFAHKNAYLPPLVILEHFLTSVELVIKLKSLSHKNNMKFDFRDNRYAVISYERLDDGSRKVELLKPDLEIKVNYENKLIEVDLKNERGQSLDEKFRKYNHYIKYCLESQMDPISEVWFITKDTTSRKRWFSVCESFIDQLLDNNQRINLKYMPLNALNAEQMRGEKAPDIGKIIGNVKYYLVNNQSVNGTSDVLKKIRKWKEEFIGDNAFYEYNNNTLIGFVPIVAYETKYLWKVIDFHRITRKRYLEHSIILHLCYSGEMPRIPDFKNTRNKEELQEVFKNIILLDVSDELPGFYNKKGKMIPGNNPLKTFLEYEIIR